MTAADWELGLRLRLNFLQSLSASQNDKRAGPSSVRHLEQHVCQNRERERKNSTDNLALAAPSIMNTFGAAESHHKSINLLLTGSSLVHGCSLTRGCMLCTFCERQSERWEWGGQQGGNNCQINVTHERRVAVGILICPSASHVIHNSC